MMSAKKMNHSRLRNWPWLEVALILSICSLVLQISGQTLKRWWQSPSPGTLGIAYLSDDFSGSSLSLAYIGYLPESYYQQASWPLIVYLHGGGGRGLDPQLLLKAAELLAEPNGSETPAVVLLPQCRPQSEWQPEEIIQFVDYASRRYRINPQRVYMLGYSMGGYGAWGAGAMHSEVLAAIVPIAGGGSNDNALALAAVPTWAFHGAKDEVVPPGQSTKLVEVIRAAGGTPKLTLYPKAGHGIRDRVFRTPELWDWLFQQSLENRPQPTTVPAVPSEKK